MFDFNGTLSDDEPLLCAILRDLFAEQGRPLTEDVYFEQLAGLSDPEIVRTWLGEDHPALDAVVQARIDRYRARVADGSTISEAARNAVLYAAERVPVGVVSGAHSSEVGPALAASGIAAAVNIVVTSDDIENGKPDPEGYLLALERLDGGLRADEVTVFEDTEAGVAAAKAAGMRCVAIPGTHAPDRLARADELAPALDLEAVRRALAR
jgi:beta-phosphoglucomutase-like phosphatase (HAD superfamily)